MEIGVTFFHPQKTSFWAALHWLFEIQQSYHFRKTPFSIFHNMIKHPSFYTCVNCKISTVCEIFSFFETNGYDEWFMEFQGHFEGYEGKEFKSTLARNSKANLQINVIEVSFAFKNALLSLRCNRRNVLVLYFIKESVFS